MCNGSLLCAVLFNRDRFPFQRHLNNTFTNELLQTWMNLKKKISGQLNKSNWSHVPAVTSREGMVRKGNDVGLLPKYKFDDIGSCKSRFSITFRCWKWLFNDYTKTNSGVVPPKNRSIILKDFLIKTVSRSMA